ncbi:MAG TPA: L,D-transpeptidase [Chloroflexi bacterium]|jgi:hypothetical protein|nr:L,D-transpeptidase [Chloroflexota bacterium]
MMNRREWALVFVLTGITLAVLLAMPPATVQQQLDALALASIPDPTAAPTVVPTSTPTATPSPTATPTITPLPPLAAPTPFPFDVRADLPRYIYIDQATQRMLIFEHGRLRRSIPCSTGLPDDDTYTVAWEGRVGHFVGTFFAFDVYADEAWYLFMSDGAILIHSLPYTLEGNTKVYQDRELLGVRPSSHGCVRISPEDARWFSAWNPQGVPITISDPYWERWY